MGVKWHGGEDPDHGFPRDKGHKRIHEIFLFKPLLCLFMLQFEDDIDSRGLKDHLSEDPRGSTNHFPIGNNL